ASAPLRRPSVGEATASSGDSPRPNRGLQRKSPQNGNIREAGRRLSPGLHHRVRKARTRRPKRLCETRSFRPLFGLSGKTGRAPDCVAGAGGIEPPNGGIKIRCLTAWLRPNARKQRNRLPQIPVIPARL